MSKAEKGMASDGPAIAERIKVITAQRRLTLHALSDATQLPYRTLQDYLRGTTKIPATALGRIAEALDVSADWLIGEREPNLDQRSLALVLEYFDDFVRPAMTEAGADAGAKAFSKLYRQIYLHNRSAPGIGLKFVRARRRRSDNDR